MCEQLACVALSGCVEPLAAGAAGQVLTQLPSTAGWSNAGDLTVTDDDLGTTTTLQALLDKLRFPHGAFTTTGQQITIVTLTPNTHAFIPFDPPASQSQQSQAGMIQSDRIIPMEDGFYDISGYIDFDAGTQIQIGGRVFDGGFTTNRTFMSTRSPLRDTRVTFYEPGHYLFANQPVRLEAWAEQAAIVSQARLSIRRVA